MDAAGAKALSQRLEATLARPTAQPTRPTTTGIPSLNGWFETIAAREAAEASAELEPDLV